MSRTSFAVRFKAIVGIPPLTYLQNLRMHFAEHELRESTIPISELGRLLGYSSESAFSSAFKRSSGMSPKHYRSICADPGESGSGRDQLRRDSAIQATP